MYKFLLLLSILSDSILLKFIPILGIVFCIKDIINKTLYDWLYIITPIHHGIITPLIIYYFLT